MAVRRLSQSFLSTRGRGKASSFIAGYGFGVDEMDLIQRTTVGAGGTAAITFSSIPQTYQHLQIRLTARDTRNLSTPNNLLFRLNGDTGTNYVWHYLLGDGSAASAGSVTSTTSMALGLAGTLNMTANVFGVSIVDILDYASTSKNKVCRCLEGLDANGSGQARMDSGLWLSTAAVTSVTMFPETSGSVAQYTVASLYGVVG